MRDTPGPNLTELLEISTPSPLFPPLDPIINKYTNPNPVERIPTYASVIITIPNVSSLTLISPSSSPYNESVIHPKHKKRTEDVGVKAR